MILEASLLALVVLGPPLWVGTVQHAGRWLPGDTRAYVAFSPLVFTAGAAAVLVIALDQRVPLGARPTYALVVPLGAVMYSIDQRIVTGEATGTSDGGRRPLVLGLVSLLGAIPEELIYRWGMYAILGSVDPLLFLGVSSVTFGLHHYQPDRPLEAGLKTANGLVYGGLLVWSGSVLLPVLCHLAYNATFVGYRAIDTVT